MEFQARCLAADEIAGLKFDEDVTNLFSEASAELQQDSWLASSDFTIEKAMNSIDLMDPKLDSAANRAKLMPVSERLRDGSLPLASLSPENASKVMDKLFQMEVCLREMR